MQRKPPKSEKITKNGRLPGFNEAKNDEVFDWLPKRKRTADEPVEVELPLAPTLIGVDDVDGVLRPDEPNISNYNNCH